MSVFFGRINFYSSFQYVNIFNFKRLLLYRLESIFLSGIIAYIGSESPKCYVCTEFKFACYKISIVWLAITSSGIVRGRIVTTTCIYANGCSCREKPIQHIVHCSSIGIPLLPPQAQLLYAYGYPSPVQGALRLALLQPNKC